MFKADELSALGAVFLEPNPTREVVEVMVEVELKFSQVLPVYKLQTQSRKELVLHAFG